MAVATLNYPLNLQFAAKWAGIFGSVRGLAIAKSRAASVKLGPATGQSRHLSVAEQWLRLSGVVSGAIRGAHTASQLQVAATQQLDLAQYGLSTMVDELAAVMALPGRRDKKASVHILETAPTRAGKQALAA